MFRKVLIANRGEIAVRIIRACRDLGIASVAVYSDADRGALHVRRADEAYPIGPAPSADSYLSTERILDAAARSGADAVHPGYGFLSENADFARAVEASGCTFVGPAPDAIALMGSKLASRTAAANAGVPVIPGSPEAVTSVDDAIATAERVGFPLMLKASGGGGGKGMRRVSTRDELDSALRQTRAEARAAFGDDAVYIERVVTRPRHVEIQIVADRHGAAIHLGERECTIQRRHQKLLEEAPSPIVDPALRERMGHAALALAGAAGYDSVGTVEFLIDGESRDFYFLEMNTRIQVEHPVTEAVTGIDLVVEQLRIAAGERLAIRQDDVRIHGAAIECRIYAEDPGSGFLPSPGRIARLAIPAGPGIRHDDGVASGWDVPVEYDPLLAKLVAWGRDRTEAIRRMRRALGEYTIDGIATNVAFFREVMDHPDFRQGEFDTGFVDRWFRDRRPHPTSDLGRDLAALAAGMAAARSDRRPNDSPPVSGAWKRSGREERLRGG